MGRLTATWVQGGGGVISAGLPGSMFVACERYLGKDTTGRAGIT